MDRNRVKLTNKVHFLHVHEHFHKPLWGGFENFKLRLKSSKSKNRFLKKLSDTVKIFILRSNSTSLVVQLFQKIYHGIYMHFNDYLRRFFS